MSTLSPELAARLKRDANGLVCAVIQDQASGRVLMVGWMNDEALARTLAEGRVTFWSRSRQEYWRKGDTSGHYQYLRGIEIDCDGDALLLQVEQVGAACHTGQPSCFDTGGALEFSPWSAAANPAPQKARETGEPGLAGGVGNGGAAGDANPESAGR